MNLSKLNCGMKKIIGKDELLGTVIIREPHQVALFTDDANYELYYTLSNNGDQSICLWEKALEDFKNNNINGVWPHIDKHELIEDMRAIIKDPFKIDQSVTNFCGPACILFELICRQPLRFVQICQKLYEVGKFKARKLELSTSHVLKTSERREELSIANWFVLASLRDTGNHFFHIDEQNATELIVGLTTPAEMIGWAFEILGYDHNIFAPTAISGEFDIMKSSQKILQEEGVAFMLIESAMIGGPTVSLPDHWISLLGDVQIKDKEEHGIGEIRFECYSWGRKMDISLYEGTFEHYMWGVVSGRNQ